MSKNIQNERNEEKDLLETLNLESDTCMYSFLHMMRASSMFMQDKIKKNSEINVQRAGMMLILHSEGNGMSQNSIAEALCVKPSSVASMLANMEKNGLVTRESDGADKRIKRIYLTDTGRKTSEDAFKYLVGIAHAFFADFTDEEKQQFVFLMNKIENNVKHGTKSEI